MASTPPPDKRTVEIPRIGNSTRHDKTQPGTVSISQLSRSNPDHLREFITQISGPRTLLVDEHTLAELPRNTKTNDKAGHYEPLNLGSGNRTVVSDGHGLLTEILMRDPIRSLFNQNVLNIHKDPAQLDKAFGVIQALILALADSSASDETRAKIEKDSVNDLKILGVDVSVDFTLENLDVVFKTGNLAKFFTNPQIADLYDGRKGKEELVYALAALLELNKTNPNRSEQELSIIKENLYVQIQEKAAAKKVQIDLDEDPKQILNTVYVNEILSLLTLKSTSDQIFKRHYATNQSTQTLLSRLVDLTGPTTLAQKLSAKLLPGKRGANLVADLCDAVYGVSHDSNRVIALSDIYGREDAHEIANQRFSNAFARLQLPNFNLELESTPDSDDLASAVMNNLIVGNQLLASPKTVKYIFLASHPKRSGVLTKHEKEDFAMSLISDLKERLRKRSLDTNFLDVLRQRMGDGRFVHFLTNKICDQLMYQEIGTVALNDIQKNGLGSIGAVEEFKMDMDSPAGKNYSPKEQVVANMIISALDKVLKTDQSLFRHTDILKAPQFKQISDEVRELVQDAGPNLNMSLKEGEALFKSLIGPVYNDIRFYVVGTHNLATFLEHTFPYAQKSASDLSQDFLDRLKILQKLNLAVTIHANIAQRVSNDMPLDIFNYDDKDSNTKFELVVGDGMADVEVRNEILNEVISEYDGLKGLEKLTDREMTPKPILFGDEKSAADFGQILYKALRKRFKFTDKQLETFDNLYLADHGKQRALSRRSFGKLALGGAVGTGVVGVVGTAAWMLNSPKPFHEHLSYTLDDLNIAAANGDLLVPEAQHLGVLRDLVQELMNPNYALQAEKALVSPVALKKDFVFSSIPLESVGAYTHFENGSFTPRYRDSESFVNEIKKSLEDTVFKGLTLSEAEKNRFATKAFLRLHDLINNYENNEFQMGKQRIPPVFQSVMMENPDPNKQNLIPIIFVDNSYLKSVALGDDSVKLYNNVNISLSALERNLQVAYHVYKVDADLKKDESPELMLRLKNIMTSSDKTRIFSRRELRSSYNKVKEVLSKYKREESDSSVRRNSLRNTLN